MSQITGSYGFGYPCLASGSSENEGFHEVDFVNSSQPVVRSLPPCHGDARVHGRAAPLESCGVLRAWDPSRGDHAAESGKDRCLFDRVGSHSRGQISERCLAGLTSFSPCKLLGAPHCVEGSKAFLAPPAGTSCAGALRQYNSCSTYQPPRRHALLQASRSGSQAVGVECTAFPVVTGDSRPGLFEQGCRPFVKGEPALRRVAAPPSDSEAALGEVRPGCRLPPRRGHSGSSMAQRATLRFPSALPDISDSGQGRCTGFVSDPHSSQVAQGTLASGNNTSAICKALAAPVAHGPPGPSERGNLSSSPRQGGSLGLARERANLSTMGLPPLAIATIQNARASSTSSLYDCKWRVFEEWCEEHQLVSYLTFLTIKVYLAAIAACHAGFGGTTVGQHPLIRRFMKGAHRSLPVTRSVVPDWDLSMVLEVLAQQTFEPLGDISLKLLSFKTALLLALASAKRVSDLHALSVHSSCTKFSLCGDKVLLRPNPAFMPKCFPAFSVGVIELSAFHPPPFSSAERGVQPPGGLRAHSTRGLAASWALFGGVPLQDICAAASWSSLHTFVRHYRLDVTRTTVAHAVLSVGSS
ncbi:hypothetical protein Q7C36_020110 [Tachysurus vachellii]|uniref:Tyr recombinase domain-containing protein n=1 Tax=Tachysurus vachellii TaxID=175792 RepID=A0AA88LT20_TACVA|nr:hypothetical protein Q7C36_020110 [Tachysurus vachellii]